MYIFNFCIIFNFCVLCESLFKKNILYAIDIQFDNNYSNYTKIYPYIIDTNKNKLVWINYLNNCTIIFENKKENNIFMLLKFDNITKCIFYILTRFNRQNNSNLSIGFQIKINRIIITEFKISTLETPMLLITMYDNYMNIFKEDSENFWKDNDNGRIVWDTTYVINSLINIYNRTKNTKYLEILSHIIIVTYKSNDMLNMNIDNNSFYNEERKLSWSSRRYTQKLNPIKYYSILFHDCLIMYYILKSHIILHNYSIDVPYTIYDDLYFIIKKSKFVKIGDDMGYFGDNIFENMYGSSDITNMWCIIGLYLCEYYNYKNDPDVLIYIKKMAKYFKYLLNDPNKKAKNISQCYTWDYARFSNSNRSEDISHEIYPILFAHKCFLLNIEFIQQDIKIFLNTYLFVLSNNIPIYIDGTGLSAGYSNNKIKRIICKLLEFGNLNYDFYIKCKEYFSENEKYDVKNNIYNEYGFSYLDYIVNKSF